jgi:hypothetical protein
MSGGGGGPIIIKRNKIRSALKTLAQESDVRGSVPSNKLSRYDAILAKSHEDWDDDETHFIRRCVGESYDND